MSSRAWTITAILAICLTVQIFFLKEYSYSDNQTNSSTNDEIKNKLIADLSLRLNQAMKKNGQLSCEIAKNDVSNNGGWCSKISGKGSPQHATDGSLVNEFSNFLKGKRVASFGDGPGEYKRLISQLSQVVVYDGYDGAPFGEETTNHDVRFLDLSVPIYHLEQYDWIISLEVAEHIPKEFESIYLDNLVRHAKEGIILSWAKIGQGGHSHVNNQNFDYVKTQMELRGFKHDQKMSTYFKSKATLSWLQDNINVYRRKI